MQDLISIRSVAVNEIECSIAYRNYSHWYGIEWNIHEFSFILVFITSNSAKTVN